MSSTPVNAYLNVYRVHPLRLAHADIVFEVFPSAIPRHVLDRRREELAVLEARERFHRTVVIRLVRQRAAYLVSILLCEEREGGGGGTQCDAKVWEES